MAENKMTGVIAPKDNRYAKQYVTFYPDEQSGSGGRSVPSGGTTGQILSKNSDDDGDVAWITPDKRSAKPFKSNWHTSTTLAAFCADVNSDAEIGEQYLGEVSCSGLPDGIGNAEVTAYKTGNGIVLLSLTSTNVAPYHWELSYLSGSLYGWRTMNVTPVGFTMPPGGFRPNIVYNLSMITVDQSF